MPALLLISASGTAQRRILEEAASKLQKKGYSAAGRQEGGEWSSLLSDNLSGGLFDENRFIVVESAAALGPFPEKLSGMVDPDGSVSLILVYDTDTSQTAGKRMTPDKLIPKDVLAKCELLKGEEFPRWPRERQQWTSKLAGEFGVKLSSEGTAMIVELLDDPEEIRAQIKSLALLKRGAPVSADDVRQLCLDDGSRNLLRLLDGLCSGDFTGVIKSLRSMRRSGAKSGDLNGLFASLQNRMRLAWYAGTGRSAPIFAKALGARDYAWKMGREADRRYGHPALTEFMSELMRLQIDERSGSGSGWNGLETVLVKLMSRERAR